MSLRCDVEVCSTYKGADPEPEIGLEGARWIRDNRGPFGLLHSGWSAEHIGDKDKPHYWDDFWGLAGL
jgi:hypothetical protein